MTIGTSKSRAVCSAQREPCWLQPLRHAREEVRMQLQRYMLDDVGQYHHIERAVEIEFKHITSDQGHVAEFG